MMILQKSRGINNFLEISDVQVPLNYEAGMLTGNSFRFIPPTEIREMDSMRTLYVKIVLTARAVRLKAIWQLIILVRITKSMFVPILLQAQMFFVLSLKMK